MCKPTLQVLITRYIQARTVARIAAKWGHELPSYISARDASMVAFDACIECCAGQPTVMQTIAAFRELEDARTQ
jgi:hypothetical protein